MQLNCTMCIITGTLLSSALPWLPVLIWLRRQIRLCWPLCAFINYIYLKNYLQTYMLCGHYITVCPQNCQTSCKPLWTDIYPTDIISQWRDERKLALVVNLADEPTVWQPGFNLPINCWALLNRFWTNHSNCTSCWNKGALQQPTCALVASAKRWHIVNSCPQTKLEGGLQQLHSADDVATEWLKTYGS